MKLVTKRTSALIALTMSGLALGGCGNGETTVTPGPVVADPGVVTEPGGGAAVVDETPVTIRVQTFNNFGYGEPSATRPGADLYNEYMAEHPNVTIVETVAPTSDDARAAFNTSIQAGQATFDIFAVEVDWLPSMQVIPDLFYALDPYTSNNDWLPWVETNGKTLDGAKQIGLGTDIGPEGICYRADLLDAAGIPSDRDSVAAWLGGPNGTWDDFFNAGDEYVQKSGGKAFFDSSAATFQGMINQLQYSWVDADGNVIAPTNADAKALFDKVTDAAVNRHQSAGLGQWSTDWNAGMSTDQFAVMLCPAWLINNIRGAAGDDFVGWDIADQFPGGGGNWGGSYLAVPEASPVREQAAQLAAWLTAPAQQAAVFESAANFPSSPSAQAMPAVATRVEPFLNNAPIGQIFSNRSAAVNVVPFKGAQYFDIQSAAADALNRVDVDRSQTPAASWEQFLRDVQALS